MPLLPSARLDPRWLQPLSLAGLLLGGIVSSGPAAEPYPAPRPDKPDPVLASRIGRTLHLLSSSTPERRKSVRILFYGQSITTRSWTDRVVADLRSRFPLAAIEADNRALGGFASQLLVRTAEYDLYPCYPDLVIIQVYGDHLKYEEMVAETRRRTTSEILMLNDHVPAAGVEDVSGKDFNDWPWDQKMNRRFLPAIADKYGCGLLDIRGRWLDYLEDNELEPSALLKDNVHLNEHGEALMAALVSRAFQPAPPDLPVGRSGEVLTFVVGRHVSWRGNRLDLPFEGNRVCLLAGTGKRGVARVLVDGRSPAEFPGCYAFTRPSGTAGVGWPAVKRFGWRTPRLIEDWTATFHDFNEDQADFSFELSGSLTGPDGRGRGKDPFVSNSGRVVIDPEDWVFEYCKRASKKATPEGFEVRWSVVPLFVEKYCSPESIEPESEHWTTLVQGLPNAAHTLSLVAGGPPPPIAELRVHRPRPPE